MLPVTLEYVKKIKRAGVTPFGIATQFSIDDKGKRKVKKSTTHDASLPPPSEQSVNNQMFCKLLTTCFYGHYLICILHEIHIMRYKHPNICIFIYKLDLDAAYRRLYVLAAMSVMIITIIQQIAYILLQLLFGVGNRPDDFCLVSELIMELTNNILRDDSWDPVAIHCPLQPLFKDKETSYSNQPIPLVYFR